MRDDGIGCWRWQRRWLHSGALKGCPTLLLAAIAPYGSVSRPIKAVPALNLSALIDRRILSGGGCIDASSEVVVVVVVMVVIAISKSVVSRGARGRCTAT